MTFDRLIVSGDLTHRGDEDSLINVQTWLTDRVNLGGGEKTGLGITDASRIGIVPGNHDAWHAPTDRNLRKRWQKSLEYYNKVFTNHKMPHLGVRTDWIERDGAGIYIAYVDSCYLGGVQDVVFAPFDGVAKGKVSVEQSETLLEYYDIGSRGKLRRPDGSFIPADLFADSLKIVVMHHFLFPPAARIAPMMDVYKSREVAVNLALADFDMLLCGHSHFADDYRTTYGKQFDDRARARYIMNCFRRAIGVKSMPVQYSRNGRRLPKKISLALNALYRYARHLVTLGSAHASSTDAFADLLRQMTVDADSVHARLESFLSAHPAVELEVDLAELNEIIRTIQIHFNNDTRNELTPFAERLRARAKASGKRRFVQVMNGSACKASTPDRKRCFNHYTIEKLSKGWRVESDEYEWDPTIPEFPSSPSERRTYTFRDI